MKPSDAPSLRRNSQPYRWLPLLIAGITVITLGIGSLALHRIETRLVATTGESLALLAADIADKLDHVLFERYGDVQMMADAFPGKMHDAAALTQYLNRMKERYLLYRWLGVTDAQGRMIAATNPASVGQDHREAGWFQAVRDGKSIHLLDVSASLESGGSSAIGLSAPITGTNGEFLGVVTTRVGLHELEDVFGQTVSAFQVLHDNRARIEWQFLMRDGTLAADSLLREEGMSNLKRQGLPSALMSGATEPGYIEELHARRQVPVITGYARTEGYGEFPGFRWGILVRVDRSDILTPIRSMVWQLGLAGGIVLGPLIGLLLWTTRRLKQEWAKSADQLARLKGLHTVSQALHQETSLPSTDFALIQFLQLIVDTATHVTGARYGAFGLFDETGKHLIRFITTGMDQTTQQTIGGSPTGRGLLGFLAQEPDVLRLKDLTRHPTFTGFPPHHPPMHSFLGASVRAHGRVFGRLYLTEKCGADEFTEIDEEVIASLAAQAGIAIESGYFMNQIRAAEAQYRTTMAALPVAVVRLDQHDVVRFANRLFYEFVRRNETDTIGQPIAGLLPYKALTALLRAVRTQRATASQEHECLSPLPGMTHCRLIATTIRETDEVILVIKDISEQKQAEETLRESERRHRNLMATMPGAAYEFCIDAAGRRSMPFISEGVVDLMGLSSAEIVADVEVAFHLVPAGALPALEQSIRDSLASLSPWLHDFPIRTTTGVDKWLRGHSIPRREEDGATYWTGVLIDITERKRTEAALLQQQIEQQVLLDLLPAMVWYKDARNRILRVNRAAAALLHKTPAEMEGQPTSAFYPEEAEQYYRDDLEVIASGRPKLNIIEPLQTASGDKRWIRTDKVPYRDETGTVIGVLVVAQDITEHKRAEDTLRRSEANLNRAQMVGHIGSWHLDIRRNELTWTEESYRIFDVPPGTPLTYERFLECVHPDDRAYVHQAWTAALHGAPYDIEHRIVTRSGPRWVREKADLEFDEQGRVSAGIGIAQDITDQKRAEEALKASEEQLRQAQKMEAVGRLAGGIAHDFNNLLMVMIGHSDALLRRLERENPLRRYPLEIKKAGDRAASLTHQLLAFSRRQALEPKVVDLNDIVASTSDMLQRLIGEHIELVTRLNVGIGRVKADPGQIEQVIMNLAINARDAMPEGGMLTVTTDSVDLDRPLAGAIENIPPGSYVALSVTDTGHGIEPATLAHIFEPFFTTKEKGKGTGLGLASVYGIVKQSGGGIGVASAPDRGTTFTVYLPQVSDPAVAVTEAEPVGTPAGGSETILLAEDEEMVRVLVREALQEAGYRILEAPSGAEALALGAEHAAPIHLLLTDVVMPHISGRELAEHLTRTRPDMKVLYLTGYTDDIVLQQGRLHENASVLHKPFLPEALLRKVRELLDAQHPA